MDMPVRRLVGGVVSSLGAALEPLGASLASKAYPASRDSIARRDARALEKAPVAYEGYAAEHVKWYQTAKPQTFPNALAASSLGSSSSTLGKGSSVWYHVDTSALKSLRLGSSSSVGDYSILSGTVEIGDNVVVGPRAVLEDGVRIQDNVVIGAGVTLPAGTVVKSNSKIPAGKTAAEAATATREEAVAAATDVSRLAFFHRRELEKTHAQADKQRHYSNEWEAYYTGELTDKAFPDGSIGAWGLSEFEGSKK